MYNIIYIADNDIDIMDIPISEYDTTSEIPAEPVNKDTGSEVSFLAGKLFVSFGTLLICIAVFIVFAFLLKKKIAPTESEIVYEETGPMESEEVLERKSPTTLNTPSSINKCIRTFLENTRHI